MKKRIIDYRIIIDSSNETYRPRERPECTLKHDALSLKDRIEAIKDIRADIEYEYEYRCENCNRSIDPNDSVRCVTCGKEICDSCLQYDSRNGECGDEPKCDKHYFDDEEARRKIKILCTPVFLR